MPEVLGEPPSPRTVLFWNGAAWQWALVDAAGHLQIDVLSTAMDPLAATAAAQALALAQLQLIEDLRNALQSVATDRLIVRGEDQLFSISGVLATVRSTVVSGADGWCESATPAAGDYFIVTNVHAMNATSPTTKHLYIHHHGAVLADFYNQTQAFAAWDGSFYGGHIFLAAGDTVRVAFAGSLVGDTGHVGLTGYYMSVEV